MLVPFILVRCFIKTEKKRSGRDLTFEEAFNNLQFMDNLGVGYSHQQQSGISPAEMVKAEVFRQMRSKFPGSSFDHLDVSWFIEDDSWFEPDENSDLKPVHNLESNVIQA